MSSWLSWKTFKPQDLVSGPLLILANALKVGKGVPYCYNCCPLAEILKRIAFSSAESCLSQHKCRYKQTEDSWCFQSLNVYPSFPSLALKLQRPSLSSSKLSLLHPVGSHLGFVSGFLMPFPCLKSIGKKFHQPYDLPGGWPITFR